MSSHTYLTFNAPLSEARAAALLTALSPAATFLDLGCGWAELLLRLVAANPGATGLGVDIAAPGLQRGRAAAAARGLADRVVLRQAEAAAERSAADVVLCVGASQAFGGLIPCLDALKARVRPGGRALLGEAVWLAEPGALVELFGALPTPLAVRAAAEARGFTVRSAEPATLAEWDDFEATWRAGLHASATPQALSLAEQREALYKDYRGVLGFLWTVLRAPNPTSE